MLKRRKKRRQVQQSASKLQTAGGPSTSADMGEHEIDSIDEGNSKAVKASTPCRS